MLLLRFSKSHIVSRYTLFYRGQAHGDGFYSRMPPGPLPPCGRRKPMDEWQWSAKTHQSNLQSKSSINHTAQMAADRSRPILYRMQCPVEHPSCDANAAQLLSSHPGPIQLGGVDHHCMGIVDLPYMYSTIH
ncbi:hypothetical protein DM02DRAFT_5370 [Periconia macrospinosa]|uniref:Uncharacterized protein n=1 Tax=Periconia macrospinosa TaxID=97972 RepID=A0A2V1EGS3_9PLEO|nr:hypothetical protein DM02DRAFT_5370 [Periconia macrospinosa]